MKKYIVMFLCMSGLLFADQQKTEFKLRDIATPKFWALAVQIPLICIKDGIKNRSANAIQALWFILKNRHIKCWHGDNDLHHNNLVVHGPDSVFLYTATKYPKLQVLLPEIFDTYTKSTIPLNEAKLKEFLIEKEQGKGVLIFGDDIDVPLRLKASLEEQGWSNEHLDDFFLNELIIKEHNSDDVTAYFKDYLAQNTESISPQFQEMLDKKVDPAKYRPEGYSWKFESVEK
jgi:hypothetical protein